MPVCFCTGIRGKHLIGDVGCYRELIPIAEYPVLVESTDYDDFWEMCGIRLNNHELFQLRKYAYDHRTATWSRQVDPDTEISNPGE
jgi:hypothetical protein